MNVGRIEAWRLSCSIGYLVNFVQNELNQIEHVVEMDLKDNE